MASNEADIIEAFVRHNLRFLDALVVLDHLSIDGTRDILQELVQEGLPLVVLHDQNRAFNQGERQTQMAREYLQKLNADFSFALDADEFLKIGTRQDLESAISMVPPGCHALVPMENYFGSSGSPDINPIRRITKRMPDPAGPRKVLLRRDFANEPGGQVSLGNHAALRVVNGTVQALPHVLLERASLAHFPVRSPEQIAKKALLGWLSHRLTRPERFVGDQPRGRPVPASHWRSLFQELASGEATVGDGLMRDGIVAYGGSIVDEAVLVEDPLECSFELRYTPERPLTALATLAAWSDSLVSDLNASQSRAK